MLVQEEDSKKNVKKSTQIQLMSDTGWKSKQPRVISTDELTQKKQAEREIN